MMNAATTAELKTAAATLPADAFEHGFQFDHVEIVIAALPEGDVTVELVKAGLELLGETWEVAAEDDIAEALFMFAEDGAITFGDDCFIK